MKANKVSLAIFFLFMMSSRRLLAWDIPPRSIIIIRHADNTTWGPNNYDGQSLNSLGLVRSMGLVLYLYGHGKFVNNTPYPTIQHKDPEFSGINYVIATNPSNKTDANSNDASSSFRQLQTIGPLAEYINKLNSKSSNYNDVVYIPDQSTVNGTEDMIDSLFTNSQYNNANILVCWSHGKMDILFSEIKKDLSDGNYSLAEESTLPTEWPNENDYFSVYILKFNSKTKEVTVIDDNYFKDLSSKSSINLFNNILDSYVKLAGTR